MRSAATAKVAGVLGTAGLPVATLALAVMEAGVPLPVPSDLLMLLVGERAGAGRIPLWAALVAFELVAVAGTTVLFVVARGPGRALVGRIGPKVGLTEARLARARALLARRGRPALGLGRATPGLRTVTVVVAAGADLPARRALPALVLGSSVFLQLHLVLGYAFGASASRVFTHAGGAVVVLGFVGLAALGAVFWIRRRRGRAALSAWSEACCPACMAVAVVLAGAGLGEPAATAGVPPGAPS